LSRITRRRYKLERGKRKGIHVPLGKKTNLATRNHLILYGSKRGGERSSRGAKGEHQRRNVRIKACIRQPYRTLTVGYQESIQKKGNLKAVRKKKLGERPDD